MTDNLGNHEMKVKITHMFNSGRRHALLKHNFFLTYIQLSMLFFA